VVFAPLLALLFSMATPLAAQAPASYEFSIASQRLAEALIQFSHQSGLAIVFPDEPTRGIQGEPLHGVMGIDAALDKLLVGTDLKYRLIDGRIVAVYDAGCEASDSCLADEELLVDNPLYVPGIEELYVYGKQVTGSRIRRSHFLGSAPVDILSSPDIELSGAQTIGDLLRYVPAVSGNSTSTAISNGGDGTATVTLRGLPASSTLVLINGRRVANDGLAGESIDLNSISPAAVERIEILKDGASAIYGSDAIAGVVNIIMKKDFYGLLLEQFYGSSSRNDAGTTTTTLQYGSGFRNGSFFLSASHFDQNEINARDRSVSRSADGRFRGGADLRSSATPSARVTLPDGQTVIRDAESGEFRPVTDADLFDFPQFTSSLVPSERSSVYTSIGYDASELVSVTLEGSYTETNAEADLAPTPIFTAFEQVPLNIAADNLYNPFGVDIEDARRRVVELPSRKQQNESNVERLALIVEGLHGGWSWELSYAWSRSEASETANSLINADNLRRGLGPASECPANLADDCVPVNLFGLPGSIDEAQREFLQVSGKVDGESELSSYSLAATRPLWEVPFGQVEFAFGMEYREEETIKKPGRLLASLGTIGGTNFERTAGDRDVFEIYAESITPLWHNPDHTQQIDLELAARLSDYSDFGDTTNPKVGLRYQVNPDWLFRTTYSEGFRAPTLNELYQGNTENQAFITDPCAQSANVGVLPGCEVGADPTRTQFLTVSGGNRKLGSEESNSYGVGLVWTPQQLPGLTASVDYFDIETSDVVSSSAQFIVDQNARFLRFKDRVDRDEQGNLRLVTATNLNVGKRQVKGADFSLNYHLPERTWGQFSAALNVAWIDEYTLQATSGAPTEDLAGTFRDPASDGQGAIPEWKGTLGVQWARNRWRGSYDVHFVSRLKEVIPNTGIKRSIDEWQVHDVQLSYLFKVANGLRLAMGVDNLLDEAAPFSASAFNDNIDGRTHDLKGRFWYAKLSQRL
jgi:iron complex outermembrane receptor protein